MRLSHIFHIYNKEMEGFFLSYYAYGVIIFFLILSNHSFWTILWYNRAETIAINLAKYFHNISFFLIIFIPVLTMKSFAEERQIGTLQLLMSAPLKESEVVVGKFASAYTLFLFMVALTLLNLVPLIQYSEPPPSPLMLFSVYFGFLLLGANLIALGILSSVLSRSQVMASLLCFTILILLWVGAFHSSYLGQLGEHIIAKISPIWHFEDFSNGIFDIAHLVYYVLSTGFLLFVSTKILKYVKGC